MAEKDPSTLKLAQAWRLACDRLARAKRELASAEEELTGRANVLGKRLDPGDQRWDESICVWTRISDVGPHEEVVVESTKQNDTHYSLRVRKGRHG